MLSFVGFVFFFASYVCFWTASMGLFATYNVSWKVVVRWSWKERLQHIILYTSFGILFGYIGYRIVDATTL